ncbi:MAG: hypothetical protein AAF654_01020 [Myxococcota bacterium]
MNLIRKLVACLLLAAPAIAHAQINTSGVSRIVFSPGPVAGASGESFQVGGNNVSIVQSQGLTNYFFARVVARSAVLIAETAADVEILLGPAELNPRLVYDMGSVVQQFHVAADGVYFIANGGIQHYTPGTPGSVVTIADTNTTVDGFDFTGFGSTVTSIGGERLFSTGDGTVFFVASEAGTSGVYRYDGVSVSALVRLGDALSSGNLDSLEVAFDRVTGGVFAIGANDDLTPTVSIFSADAVTGLTAVATANSTPTNNDPADFDRLFARNGALAVTGSVWVEAMPGGPIDPVDAAFKIPQGGSLTELARGGSSLGGGEYRGGIVPRLTESGRVMIGSGRGVPPGETDETDVLFVENGSGALEFRHYVGGEVEPGLTWTSLFSAAATPRIGGGFYVDGFADDGSSNFGVIVRDDGTTATVVGSGGTEVEVNGSMTTIVRPFSGLSVLAPDVRCWNFATSSPSAQGVQCEGVTSVATPVDFNIEFVRETNDAMYVVRLTNGARALDSYTIDISSAPMTGYTDLSDACLPTGSGLSCTGSLADPTVDPGAVVTASFRPTSGPASSTVTLTATVTGTIGVDSSTATATQAFTTDANGEPNLDFSLPSEPLDPGPPMIDLEDIEDSDEGCAATSPAPWACLLAWFWWLGARQRRVSTRTSKSAS